MPDLNGECCRSSLSSPQMLVYFHIMAFSRYGGEFPQPLNGGTESTLRSHFLLLDLNLQWGQQRETPSATRACSDS